MENGADIEEYRPMRYTSAKTTYTPDGMPVFGNVTQEGMPPMFAVSGCNGYGVTWGGGFGKVVGEALLGVNDLPVEIDAQRFATWSRKEVQDGAAEKRRCVTPVPQSAKVSFPRVSADAATPRRPPYGRFSPTARPGPGSRTRSWAR